MILVCYIFQDHYDFGMFYFQDHYDFDMLYLQDHYDFGMLYFQDHYDFCMQRCQQFRILRNNPVFTLFIPLFRFVT